MTLASSVNRNAYIGNDAVAEYDYTFKVFRKEDIRVIILDTDNLETVLTLDTDYSVNGVGDTGGGSITLIDSSQAWLTASGKLILNYKITIRRQLDIEQETDFRNQGPFFAEAHEEQFDKLIMIDQQQQDELDRSMKLPESIDPADFDTTIPAGITSGGNLALVTNDAGTAWELGPTITAISGANDSAIAAAASATAAATSATAADASATTASGYTSTALTYSNNAAASATAAQTAQSAAEAAQTAAESAETNAETAQAAAEAAQTAAETAETNAETAQTGAEQAYSDTVALLSTEVGTKDDLLNNTADQNLSATIDETTHDSGILEYILTRGTTFQYGRLLVLNESPFTVNEIEKAGNGGATFSINESAGVGTIRCSLDDGEAGTIRHKFVKFEV